MNIDEELSILRCVEDDFKSMHNMLKEIESKIAGYPATLQMGFIKPLKNMIFEATMDALNKDDTYLNQPSEPISFTPKPSNDE